MGAILAVVVGALALVGFALWRQRRELAGVRRDVRQLDRREDERAAVTATELERVRLATGATTAKLGELLTAAGKLGPAKRPPSASSPEASGSWKAIDVTEDGK